MHGPRVNVDITFPRGATCGIICSSVCGYFYIAWHYVAAERGAGENKNKSRDTRVTAAILAAFKPELPYEISMENTA